ncbi:MAG: phage protein Gp36 family protein [Pirellulaceae bacterium]
MPQTYCLKADIEAVWTAADVLASADDDSSGTLSATEEGYITRAIERAAERMNVYLEQRYILSELASNTWCRDANAAIAAYLLSIRRGNAAPAPFQSQYDGLMSDLFEIACGRLKVPQANESVDNVPSVSNFAVDLSGTDAIIRVISE